MSDVAGRWDRVKQVFQEARNQPSGERARFVRRVCGGDRELLREVESLLQAYERAGDFAERPAVNAFVGESTTVSLSDHIRPRAQAFEPGTRLGTYEISALIGVGGMGEVYRATDTNLKRQVAIKVLPAAFANDVERLARFQREAEILAALNHPNIAGLYGFEDTGGSKLLVMELVDGPTLAERIRKGRIPADEALSIAKQVADALEAAHERGIIHRDLKPSNVKVRPDGTVKVLDFGVAKAIEPDVAAQTIAEGSPAMKSPPTTRIGVVLGTAAYMSPEQARGRPVDKRADIWAFGCVLYEMVTGTCAFEAMDTSTTLAGVITFEPDLDALPGDTPLGVRQALRLCLQKNPRQRGGDIAAIRLALEGAFENARAIGAETTPVAPAWRRATPSMVALAVGVLLTGFATWTLWPAAESGAVSRFDDRLRQGQIFRNAGWSPLAVSPDGRSFVYNTSDGLYLRMLEELEARLIPGTQEDLAFPFFSPDGQSLAYFTSTDPNRLMRISISGGTPVVIADVPTPNPYGASWGPDGTILFGQSAGIMRVPAQGGTPKLVIAAEEGTTLFGPRLMPDGDSVLFTEGTGVAVGRWDEARIVVQSLSSGRRTVVVKGGSDPRYLPTGHLVYAFGDTLRGVPFDLTTLTVTGNAVPLEQGVMRALNGLTGSANYEISNQGTLVYARALDKISSTFAWVDRRGRATPFPAMGLESLEYPRLSPDGTKLAVIIDGDLWVYDLGGRPPIKLTFDGGNYSPVWAPNGLQLVYEGTSPPGLFRILADGSQRTPEPVLVDGHFHVHGWLDSGDELIVVAYQETPNIVRWRIGTPVDLRPVVGTPAREGADGASLSPDGRWLAYASNQTGRQEIWVQPYGRRGTPVRVSPNGGIEPVWARTGRELFYLEGTRLMAVAVSTNTTFTFKTPEFLFESSYRKLDQPPSYDVAGDGRFVMIRANEGERKPPQIVVVQNWYQELKRLVPTK
jgi:serine/threonine-protein kinase